MIPQIALAPLEKAVNAFIQLDPEMNQRLQSLKGKVVALELKNSPLLMYIQIDATGLKFYADYTEEVDTRIIGSALPLLKMGLAKSTTDSWKLLSDGVEIQGDVEFGQQFKAVLDSVDIDWEEHLSKIIGDVAAHQIGSTVRQVFNWGERASTTFKQNCMEYLQEESQQLPPAEEIDDFYSDIDDLRMDVDRLQARVQRLKQHGEGES